MSLNFTILFLNTWFLSEVHKHNKQTSYSPFGGLINYIISLQNFNQMAYCSKSDSSDLYLSNCEFRTG